MTTTRRNALKAIAASSFALASPLLSSSKPKNQSFTNFRFCLNTSTISGQNLGLEKYIDIAANAGYDGIEIWIKDLQNYLTQGKSLSELKQLIKSSKLIVESAIGFAPWLTNKAGMDQMKQEMEMIKNIGGIRIAAPAAGIPKDQPLNLHDAGKKYNELLRFGMDLGVKPMLEFWGSWPPFNTLGQALQVAAIANHSDACLLADVYHLFRGGSGFNALNLISGKALEVFHMNDFPDNIPRDKQVDADRVFPGDGVAPLSQILSTLNNMGGTKILSLELFNKTYWKQDPLIVAKTGLQKMKNLVANI